MRRVYIFVFLGLLFVSFVAGFFLYKRTPQSLDTSKITKPIEIASQSSPSDFPFLKTITVNYVQLNSVTSSKTGGLETLQLDYSFLDGDKKKKLTVITTAPFSITVDDVAKPVFPKEATALLQKDNVYSLVFMYVEKPEPIDFIKLCGSTGEACVNTFGNFGKKAIDTNELKSKIQSGDAVLQTNEVWLFSVGKLISGRD